MALPPIASLASLPRKDKLDVLDALFEPSSALHVLSLPAMDGPCDSYAALVARVHAQLTALANSTAPDDLGRLDSILGSHPRLGAKRVDSEQSRAEQASLGQGAGDGGDEAARLAALNQQYEAKYTSLRYVVFVNGRPRNVIMQDMQERIANSSLERERRLAIQAMCDIANDRAGKLLPAA